MTIINPANVQPRVQGGVSTKPLLNRDTPTDTLLMGQITILPGEQQAPHMHEDEEAWIVLEGVGEFQLGEMKDPVSKGMVVHGPAGIPHCFKNTGSMDFTIVFIHAIHSPKTTHF